MVPLIVGVDRSIPAMQIREHILDQFKVEMGSVIPSMNMFGMVAPRGIIDSLVALDPVTELHLDTPQFAFQTPQPPFPGLPPLPFMLPGMGGDPMTEGLDSFFEIADVFSDNIPQISNEGWIPTAEALKSTNVPELWKMGLEGVGVNVAVLDTGVDNNNPQLQGVVQKRSAMKPFPMGDDENGHGTWCITCIKGRPMRHPMNGLPVAGVAPKCSMTSWKVLGYGIGTGATSDIMAAIDQSIQDGNQILSMSLGSAGREDEELDPMVQQINQYAVTHPQVLIVVAAGNSGPDAQTLGLPGLAEGSITVGSWGLFDRQPAYFSSRGPTIQIQRVKPDIAAPGGGRAQADSKPEETLFSGTSIGSFLDGFTDKIQDGFTSIAGTSMATPGVAGILSLWKQMVPDLTGNDVKSIFAASGQQKDNVVGHGLIDATWITNFY
jgi:subtilisin family serine protease